MFPNMGAQLWSRHLAEEHKTAEKFHVFSKVKDLYGKKSQGKNVCSTMIFNPTRHIGQAPFAPSFSPCHEYCLSQVGFFSAFFIIFLFPRSTLMHFPRKITKSLLHIRTHWKFCVSRSWKIVRGQCRSSCEIGCGFPHFLDDKEIFSLFNIIISKLVLKLATTLILSPKTLSACKHNP